MPARDATDKGPAPAPANRPHPRPAAASCHFRAGIVRQLSLALLLFLSLLACQPAALAHRTTDSYLALTITNGTVECKWDIGIADLAPVVGIKPAPGTFLSADDIQTCLARARDYALPRLTITAHGRTGVLRLTEATLEHHTDGVFAALNFTVESIRHPRELEIHYRLFFDDDPLHRGLMLLRDGTQTQTAVFNLESTRQTFQLTHIDRLREFAMFFHEGIRHIWGGYDHVLFLLALLFPAVLRRPGQHWEVVEHFRPALLNVVKVVTAFTLAHSLTLSLAALRWVNLPSRWVESAIAASVILAATNNLRPFFQGREWTAALVFGLLHGLGFASALGELGLRTSQLWQTLAAFNLGVEAGQLVIVAVFLPVAYRLRATPFYQRGILTAGSFGIALLALVWLIERLFDFNLFPA